MQAVSAAQTRTPGSFREYIRMIKKTRQCYAVRPQYDAARKSLHTDKGILTDDGKRLHGGLFIMLGKVFLLKQFEYFNGYLLRAEIDEMVLHAVFVQFKKAFQK